MMKDLARGLTLAALALCVVSSLALAQDPVPGELEDLDALLGTAVSTGAKYDQTTRQVAGSVTIITAEDIRRFGYRTLKDALQSMAGIYGSYDRNDV